MYVISTFVSYIFKRLDLSIGISYLIRLGLIHHEDNSINGFDYNCFKTVNIIVNNKIVIDNKNRAEGNGITTSIDIQGQVIMQNDFGRSFADTCL